VKVELLVSCYIFGRHATEDITIAATVILVKFFWFKIESLFKINL